MTPKTPKSGLEKIEGRLVRFKRILLFFSILFFGTVWGVRENWFEVVESPIPVAAQDPSPEPTSEEVVNGIHVSSGLVAEGDYELVVQNCLACHSSKLITQNRMSADRWRSTLEWMQETQNLWDLGENKEKIVAYLGQYYKPEKKGRRKKLEVEEWYMID